MIEISRGEMIDIVCEAARRDPAYRRKLLRDPRLVLSEQLNLPLSPRLRVVVLEETADTCYLVAPYIEPQNGDELSDADLERVCGGKSKGGDGESGNTYICNNNSGIGTRVEINVSAL